MTSEGGLDPFLHALPPAQHAAIFRNEIVPDVLDVAPPSASPSVLVLGGRAGSGKTFLKRGLLLVREDEARRAGRPPDRPVDLGTDELRDYHPDWRLLLRQDDVTAAFYTTYDCRLWVDEAIAYCIAPHPSDPRRGGPKPVIFDTQLNDPDRARDLLSRFRAAGYKPVYVAFAAVAVPVSQLGALQRYWDQRQHLGGGRYAADPGASDPGILATAELVDREHLADVVEVYRRGDTEPAYRNTLTAPRQWEHPAGTGAALTAEWTRRWTREESLWFAERCGELAGQMGARWWPELAGAARRAAPLSHPDIDLAGLIRRLDSPGPPGTRRPGLDSRLDFPSPPAPGGGPDPPARPRARQAPPPRRHRPGHSPR
jgi:hypothetical protein